MRIIIVYNNDMDYSSPTNQSQALSPKGEKVSKQCSHTRPVPRASGCIRLSTESLFQSAKEIEIEHSGEVYRLRQTALGKLILTK